VRRIGSRFVTQEVSMAVEQARIHIIPKPWGRTDLRPWHVYQDPLAAVGEAWFERADPSAPLPTLLLKLIFTDGPPSNPLHPDAALARSIVAVLDKYEAWYVLSATPDARVAVGLTQELTRTQMRACIRDGTIAERVQWQAVRAGDCTFAPPGSIHAIGSGLVIVEIQQRADATLPLLDHGRGQELPVDLAVAATRTNQCARHASPRKLTAARTLLVASPRFVLERMTLAPGVVRELDAAAETWLFILAGAGQVDSIEVEAGNAVFVEGEPARIEVGATRLHCLVAYARSVPAPYLLRRPNGMRVPDSARSPSRTSLQAASAPVSRAVPAEEAP
jgi:mannose-6-phosphate isomerase